MNPPPFARQVLPGGRVRLSCIAWAAKPPALCWQVWEPRAGGGWALIGAGWRALEGFLAGSGGAAGGPPAPGLAERELGRGEIAWSMSRDEEQVCVAEASGGRWLVVPENGGRATTLPADDLWTAGERGA